MQLPKIIFVYSPVYNSHWEDCVQLYPRIVKKKHPSFNQILAAKKRIEKLWNLQGNKILTEMSKIMGLSWPNENILCYLVGNSHAMSDPLTIQIESTDVMFDNLTHELIHQLLAVGKNLEKTQRAWSHISKKYKKESFVTKVHIPVHAIHKHIYLNFFGQARYKRDVKACSTAEYYWRSWEIVEKEGYENIIKDFKKLIT